jgi:hypothetical protein
MIPARCASLALLCVLVSARAARPSPPERSISTSRQFLVYGADVRLRGAICELAEEAKRDVLQLLDRRDEWTTPIVVHAQYPQSNRPEAARAALSFAQTGFGLRLQLDLTISSDASRLEIRRELLHAILLEMIYRRKTTLPAGASYVSPPDWLLDGIPPRQSDFDQGELINLLRPPLNAHKITPLEEFLRPRKLSGFDAPSRSLYRAYSFALVDLLLHLPEGRGRLDRFIADLSSTSNDPMADLGDHFPELLDADRAEKAWSSHIAWLAAGQSFQMFSAEETERKLGELLSSRIPGTARESRFRLDEYPRFIRNAPAKLALARLSLELSALTLRASPMYRQLICDYEKITALLARGKTIGVADRLTRLQESRNRIAARVQKIDDYMNWFEATQSRGPSGAFTDYLKAAERASQPERKRRDPISVYLDVLETQLQD